MSDQDTRQRSTKGDARRELMEEADRVFRGDDDRRIIHLRRSADGHIYVDGFEPDPS
jgi:hypothetical protein